MKIIRIISIIAVWAVLSFCFSEPSGMTLQAWRMLVLFGATIFSIVCNIAPIYYILLVSIFFASIFNIINIETQAFTGFGSNVPWLLLFILGCTKAINKTTIGVRIAYFFIKIFGRNILGLAYGIMSTEAVLAAIIPSNTARAASVGLPIVESLAQCTSEGNLTRERHVGSFLSLVYTSASAICSGLFITAMVSNSVIVQIAKQQGVNITWLSWVGERIIPYCLIMFVIPVVLYFIIRPSVSNFSVLRKNISDKLSNMPALNKQEKIIIAVFAIMLLLWIFSGYIDIPIITTTIIGLCIFLVLNIVTIKDCFSDFSTINMFFMLGFLISYINCLVEYGAIDWFNTKIAELVAVFPQHARLYALSLIYFLSSYFFSGEGTKILALNMPFVITGVAFGIDKHTIITTLAVFSTASSVLSYYSGPASILLYSTGYTSALKWMSIGFLNAVIIVCIWFFCL